MAEKEKQEVTEKPTQKETPQEQSGAGLSLNDLGVLRNIIDIASQRGAFKPNEMVTVGQVYEKLDSFLSQVSQQQNL